VEKIDLKKKYKQLYGGTSKDITVVTVPALTFLMVDGKGDPNTSKEYADAVEALFSVSYTAKFMMKKRARPVDYGVMPLEGLWWADDMSSFMTGDKSAWKWTAMIMQPSLVPDSVLRAAMKAAGEKKDLPALARMRIEEWEEGKCAQVVHIGPFSEEGPTIARLHAFIDGQSSRRGKHHEIYMSDVRRVAPAKWKTIIRQPMK
jgi:hypothetical protein